ncbi:MAG: sugar ABC transporter substrate-binding protein [Lachnospiraceae bacterium]|nr:sugar ABC transporter substrate-binding protein [Lachnospiraceae bacterium]
MKLKRIFSVICALVMMLSLTACEAANQENAKGEQTESSTQTAGEAGGGSETKEKGKNPYSDPIKIAWIPTAASEANGTAWGKGIGQELAYWPNVEFNIFDGEKSSDMQNTIIADLIAQGYDGIILQAWNSDASAKAVADAEAAGIPVVCINIDVNTPHAGLVAMTDVEAGYAIGKRMAEDLNGKGNVVVIQATPGAARGESLEQGFQQAMAEYPEITILDEQTAEWNMEKANTVMQDFLTTYGDQIDAVFAHNDQMAEGAGEAVRNAGRSDIMIWGANGETKALEYIEEGIITGTVYTNCYDQGATAARMLMMHIGSDTDTSAYTKTPVIKMPPMVIDADNVDSITEDMRW